MPEMAEEREVHDLAELLQVGRAGEGKDPASVADIQEAIGLRSFRPRLSWLTEGPFTYAIAAICILIALPIPPLELMPFAAAAPALAVTLFGLGLIALAFGFSAACFFLAARSLW
jgi:hypothetical protein